MATPIEHADKLAALRYIAAFSVTDGMRLLSQADVRARAIDAGLLRSVASLARLDGTSHEWDVEDLAQDVRVMPAVDGMFNAWFATLMIAVHDVLQDVPDFPHPEVVQFARHLRNAAAHNMHIHITSPLRKPAVFGDLEITEADHERPVLELAGMGDIPDLLDFVIDELRRMN